MNISKQVITVLLVILAIQPAMCQITAEQVEGSWTGALDLGSVKLRLGFNISLEDNGTLSATLDSPDQGAMGVPMGDVTLKGDSLRIEAPSIMGYYKGLITSPVTMEGTWNQSGQTFKLDLQKQDSVQTLNRPQEPQPPFPYTEEEVIFRNAVGDFFLGGTITLPAGESVHPAVVLVSGSGNQNRDEEIFGHKPFKVIADHLTRNGIIVLRYDDRGVGASGGNAAGSTSEDLASDAEAAFKYLAGRKETDSSKTGMIGHSEGAMIALMLAAGNKEIDFVVSLAGPGTDGKTLLLDQVDHIRRLSGVDPSILEDDNYVMEKVFDIIIRNESHTTWQKETLEFMNEYYPGESVGTYTDQDIERIKQTLLGSIPESVYPWMRYFLMFDPLPYLQSVTCPVLALNGEKDSQVLAEKNITAIRKELTGSGNTKVKAEIVPGLNHLFQHCDTGLPGEYGMIEETFDQGTLELMTEWILQQ